MNLTSAGFMSLASAASLLAGAAIEGTVQAPPAKAPVAAARWEVKATSVAKPEPLQAVVYLEGPFPAESKTGQAQVIQKSFQFDPGILPVQTGAVVAFPNLDPDYHNVFSYSKPKRFDLGRYRSDEKAPTQTFDKPGVVKLYCEIHEHMRGTILVLETPHFTRADPATGKYRLENLPPGRHTLKLWANDKTVEKTVELKDGETLTVDFN